MDKKSSQERCALIVDALSEQIQSDLQGLHSEECRPGGNADESDDYIRSKRKQIFELRRLRQEIEHCFFNTTVNNA